MDSSNLTNSGELSMYLELLLRKTCKASQLKGFEKHNNGFITPFLDDLSVSNIDNPSKEQKKLITFLGEFLNENY